MKPVAEMTEQEKAQTRAWIKNWQELGPILEAERRKSIRRVNTAESIEAFDLAYKSARLHHPNRKSSGLVEQQRW
ncbi:MAG: hypothetical protein ACR2H1_10455, partial [Limisphaerales bacterium]